MEPGTRKSIVSRQASRVFAVLLVALILLQAGIDVLIDSHRLFDSRAMVVSGVVWVMLWWFVRHHLHGHPHERFGAANVVTSVRAALTVLLAVSLPAIERLGAGQTDPGQADLGRSIHAGADPVFWWVSAVAAIALLLDGLDGKLARESGLSSAFGARFDMETDALLGLVITLLVWRSGELGVWVLGLGVLRYLFLLAGYALPPLRGELYPSFRRKLVCVVQVGVLSVLLTPVIEPPLSAILAASALTLLVGSFARDVLWLLKRGDSDVT